MPFVILLVISIATTFSPIVNIIPDRAAPIASPSQLFLAILVEPNPGITTGNLTLIPLFAPIFCSKFTFGKIALSGSASIPMAPTAVPIILK